MRGIPKSLFFSGCAAVALIAPNAAHAQDSTDPQAAQAEAAPAGPTTAPVAPTADAQDNVTSGAGSGDEVEIVVTANKREESLNKVGLSVTAISGDTLAERRITSAQDIAAVIPGLKYSESGTSTPIYTLRGIGFNEESLGVYPSVTVYVDEVPLPFPVLTLHAAYDLQRVEALKGPQGTLFGENATGGAINYIAAKPTNILSYGGDISYGRFNNFDGNAFISGPLGANVEGRIAITGMNRQGWQKSYTRSGDRNGATRYLAGRGTLSFEPSAATRLQLTINAWKDTSEPQAGQLIAVRPQQPTNVDPTFATYPFSPENPRAADFSTGFYSPSSNRKFGQAALRADVDLGTFATLTSITSYLDFKQKLSTDKDGTSLLVANLAPSDAKIRSFNQELRLASQGDGPFRWVVGGNYENSRTFEDQTLRFLDGSSSNPFTLEINSTGSEVLQRIRNVAAFGNVQYDVAERITLKAGGRYTSSRNRADLCGTANGDGNVAALFNILGSLIGTVPFTPIGIGDCYVLNFQGVPGDRFTDTLKEDNFSWLVGADFRATPDTLLYANVSRGYKAGSYPTLAASTFEEYIPVTQESVTSYEAGFKTKLFDRNVQLNAAAFYYDYKDKQVRGKIVDPVFDVLDTLLNIPKSRIYGAEAEMTFRPMRGLTVTSSLTYLNSKITKDNGLRPTAYGKSCTNSLGAASGCDFIGEPLPFTPEWSYGVDLDYDHRMANGSSIFGGVGVRGQSKSVSTLYGDNIEFRELAGSDRHITTTDRPFVIPGYAVFDARVGYGLPGGNAKIMLWGKNIFNKYYYTNVNHFLDATVRFAGMPATYGLTLSFKN